MSQKIRPLFKCHGGKYYLSSWIIKEFPFDYEDMVYCEPYVGAGSVALNKKKSKEEIVNDINSNVVDMYKAIRDDGKAFISKIKRINYSEKAFLDALKKKGVSTDYVENGINEYIIRRMSRGGLGETFSFSERQRGGKPGDVNAWETMVADLKLIQARTEEWIILNKDALDLIKAWNDSNCLLYLDPPYLPSTRTAKSAYDFEMTEEQHIAMLNAINNTKAKVVLSGYNSKLYREHLEDWKMIKKSMPNHSSQEKTKKRRMECLWKNF